MPTFTAEELLHPNPNFGVCFALDVLLSGLDEANWTVRAYVGEDFSRSVISAPLAKRLGLVVVDREATGEIVFQSFWEIGTEGPVIHRSSPVRMAFRLAHPNAGEAYLHFTQVDTWPFTSCSSVTSLKETRNVLIWCCARERTRTRFAESSLSSGRPSWHILLSTHTQRQSPHPWSGSSKRVILTCMDHT